MPKQELAFRTKITNYAGMLGYSPDPRKTPFVNDLGAFFTNPVSLFPRLPAETRCAIPFPGGVLLHSGYPNPGLVKVIQKHQKQWQSSTIPVILHIMVDDENGLEKVLRILEDAPGPSGLEISFKPGSDLQMMARSLRVAATEWPVIAQLDIGQMSSLLPMIGSEELSAVSFSPMRGSLPAVSSAKADSLVTGRMFGAALYPQALTWLKQAITFGVPVIASGGVTTGEQVDQMLNAGAIAVQLDTAFWKSGSVFQDDGYRTVID
jgi:dihydroorotate dehydrogenase (NAD+) catalytic subunit